MTGEVTMPLEGELTIYLASGKKKHSRFFWVEQTEDTGLVQISWGKSLRSKTCKTKALVAVEETPTMRDPRTMFDEVDDDGSGFLDPSEVARLYKKARGESLSKRELKNAMAQMDVDGDNQVQFTEFEKWWRDNGGDLAKHTERALTIQAGDLELLLVAKTLDEKRRWVSGCRQLLRSEAVLSEGLADTTTSVSTLDISTRSDESVDEEDPAALMEYMKRGQMLQMYLPNGKLKHERFFALIPGDEPMLSWAPRPGGKAKTAVIVSVQHSADEAPKELHKFVRTLMTVLVRPGAGEQKALYLVAPDRRTRRLWLAGCHQVLMKTPIKNGQVALAVTSTAPASPAAVVPPTRPTPAKHEAELHACGLRELRQKAVEIGCDEGEIEEARDADDAKSALIALIMNSTTSVSDSPSEVSTLDLHSSGEQAYAGAPRDLFDWIEPAEAQASQTLKRQPKYPWMQLSTAMRKAATILGYTEDRWPSHPNDEGGSWPHWDELSDFQKDAAGVLGIKAKDWHSEKLQREIEVVYVDRGRLGIGFAKDMVPLRVSSLAGKSKGRGVEVGMRLSKVQGREAMRCGPFADAVAQLAELVAQRPLTLAFANAM